MSAQRLMEPASAAIVVIPDTYQAVRRTMGHLQAQTAAKQIEVTFVVPSQEQCGLDKTEPACFHSRQVVEIGAIGSIGHGYAAGAGGSIDKVTKYDFHRLELGQGE